MTGSASPAPAAAVRPPSLPDDDDLELLLLVRHFELRLLELFASGAISGTTHTCIGQEYIPVALRPLLDPDDFVLSNHRGHGHYLARFNDPEGLLAEIMGRAGSICRGVGGSQHIYRTNYLSTGIQGESLPVATGVALHFRKRRQANIAVAYIGDGTWGEGAVYEALNMAQLWQVPLLVVVENNGIAQSTMRERNMAGTVEDRTRAFGIRYCHIDGHDIPAIRSALGPLLDQTRRTPSPMVAEFATHRIGPHSKGDDARTSVQIQDAANHDWYESYRRLAPEPFGKLDRRQRDRIADLASEIAQRPPSSWAP